MILFVAFVQENNDFRFLNEGAFVIYIYIYRLFSCCQLIMDILLSTAGHSSSSSSPCRLVVQIETHLSFGVAKLENLKSQGLQEANCNLHLLHRPDSLRVLQLIYE